VKRDRLAGNWGMDNLVILCASTFDCIRREGYTRADMHKALFEAIQIPSLSFSAVGTLKNSPSCAACLTGLSRNAMLALLPWCPCSPTLDA